MEIETRKGMEKKMREETKTEKYKVRKKFGRRMSGFHRIQ